VFEVLSENLRTTQVDMAKLTAGSGAFNVHQDADNSGQGTRDVNLLSAQKWDVNQTEGARSRSGECALQVWG